MRCRRRACAVFADLITGSGILIPVNCMVRLRTCIYHQLAVNEFRAMALTANLTSGFSKETPSQAGSQVAITSA